VIAPFGMDNRAPLFALRSAKLAGPPQVWNERHLRIAIRQGGRNMLLKAWGMAERAAELAGAPTVDLAFQVERDRFYGGLDLITRDWRMAEAAAAI